MKKFIKSLVLSLALVVVALPSVASAYNSAGYEAPQTCYDYEEHKYYTCDHKHVSNNYYYNNRWHGSYNYSNYYYGGYYNTTKYVNQTYYKPVSRYVCDYDYYYGNRCSYKTDYVKSYRQVPASYSARTTNYNYSNYPYNYSNYPYTSYNYGNYGYEYPYYDSLYHRYYY